VEGYTFENSRAVRSDKFMGLAIDFENQGSLNEERISAWIEQLRSEFQ
jgi:flavodoxin I